MVRRQREEKSIYFYFRKFRLVPVSKNAFRGFGNPPALEGNRRDVDRVPEKS